MAWQAAASTTVVARVSRADLPCYWGVDSDGPSTLITGGGRQEGERFLHGRIIPGIARFASQNDKLLFQLDLSRSPGLVEERLLLAVEAQKYPTPSVLRLERQATSRRRRVL